MGRLPLCNDDVYAEIVYQTNDTAYSCLVAYYLLIGIGEFTHPAARISNDNAVYQEVRVGSTSGGKYSPEANDSDVQPQHGLAPAVALTGPVARRG